ncbi:MAG: quinolinate synthase NadA [Candidatus Diapherotrites archaeon]|nr:quinolinate synthase NadA [Candidatus Diapherotrites archaeon]
MDFGKIINEIKKLKSEKNAICLVHNYQRPEIYQVADIIGDSLELAKAAAKTDADTIVFCGVDFMAESAKILNPEKKVLIPKLSAKCPMAAMATASALREKKKQFPEATIVSYVNTSAEVKAESDICCTSANAIKVVNSLPAKQILFVPDEHLASWVEKNSDKEIIKWPGFCNVHAHISPDALKDAKRLHPDAKVIAHPECKIAVLDLADHVCSTGGMIDYAKDNPAKEFIIATEEGMVNRLRMEVPEKEFYPIGGTCTGMKAITLEDILSSLKTGQYEVTLDEDVVNKAKRALDRMMEL